MFPDLATLTVKSLLRDADREALRIIRACRASRHEREDLRQDLLLDLLRRLEGFDPSRGSIGAFAQCCFAHRGLRLMQRIRRDRAVMAPVSLDDRLSSAPGLTPADMLAEEDGYAAWMGQSPHAASAAELRMDLDRAISSLPSEQQSHCRQLAADDVAPSLRSRSRSTEFRRTVELRLELLARGVASPA